MVKLWGPGAFLPAALLLALAGVGVLALSPVRLELAGGSLGERVPLHWGAWEGTELTLTEKEMAELEPEGMIARTYRRAGGASRPVSLLVLFWGSNAAKPHAPEVCLASAGYAVFDEQQARLAPENGPEAVVNVFRARRGMTERVVYYWWYTNRGATGDFGAFKKETAMRGVLGEPSWGAFIRVDAAGLREEAPALDRECREMSQELLRLLPDVFRIS